MIILGLDKETASWIVKAQMCSDSGKGFGNTYFHDEWKDFAEEFGYEHKPLMIFKACDRISRLKGKSGFNFYAGTDDYGAEVIYFNFKLGGDRYQVSFHMPDGIPARYKRGSHHTKWNRICYGSIEACEMLGTILNMNGH